MSENLIAHGTDASDGIEPGVHLRWAFYHKLGFPPEGFYLYRSPSDLNNRICFEIGKLETGWIDLPFKYSPRHKLKPTLTVNSKNEALEVKEVSVSHKERYKVLRS